MMLHAQSKNSVVKLNRSVCFPGCLVVKVVAKTTRCSGGHREARAGGRRPRNKTAEHIEGYHINNT